MLLSRVAHGGKQWRAHLSRGGMVDVGRTAAQRGLANGGVLHQVISQVLDWLVLLVDLLVLFIKITGFLNLVFPFILVPVTLLGLEDTA